MQKRLLWSFFITNSGSQFFSVGRKRAGMLKLKVPGTFNSNFSSAISAKLLQLLRAVTITNHGIFLITHGTDFLLKIKHLANKLLREISIIIFPCRFDRYNSILIITSSHLHPSTCDSCRLIVIHHRGHSLRKFLRFFLSFILSFSLFLMSFTCKTINATCCQLNLVISEMPVLTLYLKRYEGHQFGKHCSIKIIVQVDDIYPFYPTSGDWRVIKKLSTSGTDR